MTPLRPHRSRLSCIGFAALMIGAVALAVHWGSAHRSAKTPTTVSSTASQPGSASTASLSPELARIFAEPNDVLREHLLANWVAARTLEQINTQLVSLSEEQRLPIAVLATLKIRDMAQDSLSYQERRHLLGQHAALYRDNPSAFVATTLLDTLLEQAYNDPLGTFRKVSQMRMDPGEREEVQSQILNCISQKDPQQALALLSQMRGLRRSSALGTIVENWTRIDPAAALAWARQQPASSNTVYAVLRGWSWRDPSAALEAAAALPPDQAARFDMKELLKTWMEQSAAESVAWLETIPNPDPQLIAAAVEALGKSNPQVAQSLLAHPLSAPLRAKLTAQLASDWAETDPVAAARWVQSLPKDQAYHRAMESVFGQLIKKDLSAALALYRSLPEGSELSGIAYSIAPELPAHEALAWLLSQPSSEHVDSALGQTLYRPEFSTASQLQAALAKISPGPALNLASSIATRRQFFENPAGLTDWLRALPNNDARVNALKTIGNDWAEKSLADAKAYALELGSGPAFDALIPRIQSGMAVTNPAVAAEWLLSLPASEAARQSVDDAFRELAQKTPSAAIDKIRALPVGETRSAALEGLVSGLPTAQATQILFTIGTPAEQLALINTLAARSWFNTPAEASAWLQTLPVGPLRDAALSSKASQLATQDPAAPLSLLSMATADEARYSLARASLLALQYKDEQAARTALARLTLPPDTLARLKQTLDDHTDH
jgi:hypothetical protein